MGAEERPQQPLAQPDGQANYHGAGEGSEATAYRRAEAQELNQAVAQDLQNAAAAGHSPAAVSPATAPQQDGVASREASSLAEDW